MSLKRHTKSMNQSGQLLEFTFDSITSGNIRLVLSKKIIVKWNHEEKINKVESEPDSDSLSLYHPCRYAALE